MLTGVKQAESPIADHLIRFVHFFSISVTVSMQNLRYLCSFLVRTLSPTNDSDFRSSCLRSVLDTDYQRLQLLDDERRKVGYQVSSKRPIEFGERNS